MVYTYIVYIDAGSFQRGKLSGKNKIYQIYETKGKPGEPDYPE